MLKLVNKVQLHTWDTTNNNNTLFQDNLGKPVPER